MRRLGLDDLDAVIAAAEVFDDPPDPAATRAFLADEGHHLLLAYEGETAIGMLTAVELLHPDKPRPEMFIYELGVLEAWQRRGVATALLKDLVALCRARDVQEMFVLTDDDNEAAFATYRKAGGEREATPPELVLFAWDWR